MRPPSSLIERIARTTKWFMTPLTLAVTALILLDARGYTFYWGTRQMHQCGAFVEVQRGTFAFGFNTLEGNPFEINRWKPALTKRERLFGFGSFSISLPWVYEPPYCRSWIVFVSALVPTLLLWSWPYRSASAAACLTCRYSRTGLPSQSVCPECGTPATLPA